MEVQADGLIEELKAQRNDALDQVAMLTAVIKQLQREAAENKEGQDES